MSDAETPQYEHDCDVCRFLGRYEFVAQYKNAYALQRVDLYVCNEQFGADFIARRSSEPAAYTSYALPQAKELLERVENAKTVGTFSPGVAEAYRRYTEEKKEKTNEASSLSER